MRKKRLFGFGGGFDDGGGGPGILTPGGGGVRGTFSAGIVLEVGVAGVGACEFGVTTVPGGNGSDVAGLADPGSTTGLESGILGLSA